MGRKRRQQRLGDTPIRRGRGRVLRAKSVGAEPERVVEITRPAEEIVDPKAEKEEEALEAIGGENVF